MKNPPDYRRVKLELDRIDWAKLRDIRASLDEPKVSAEYVPDAVIGLLYANDKDEAKKHYWRLENHIVVQGQTFEAAEYLVPILIASLNNQQQPFVRLSLLELIFQMIAYSPHRSELAHGNSDLTEKCLAKVRESSTVFSTLLLGATGSERELIRAILEQID